MPKSENSTGARDGKWRDSQILSSRLREGDTRDKERGRIGKTGGKERE